MTLADLLEQRCSNQHATVSAKVLSLFQFTRKNMKITALQVVKFGWFFGWDRTTNVCSARRWIFGRSQTQGGLTSNTIKTRYHRSVQFWSDVWLNDEVVDVHCTFLNNRFVAINLGCTRCSWRLSIVSV